MHVQCLGAVERVTGSCHLVQAGNFRILLDCGLIQGRHQDEALNTDPFPFDVSRIDAVVLSHAHIDHSGRIRHHLMHNITRPECHIVIVGYQAGDA
jgi:metallo-beta-lactamase family protein